MSKTYLRVPAKLESLTPIAQFVAAVAASAGLSQESTYRLRLAVEELATNVIQYGYPQSEGVLELHSELDEATVRVLLEDQGTPFDPGQVPPPSDLHLPAEQRKLGGLGIYLARQSVDSYAYERVAGRNRSLLIVNRPPSPKQDHLQPKLTTMPTLKGKIGVLVESHFDETEYHRFVEFFPKHGYEVEYLSHLWDQRQLTFTGNDTQEKITVDVEVNSVAVTDYVALILIGGYAMDRLRYEENPQEGRPNQAPAVVFLRKAVREMEQGRLVIGAICHGLWLFCASPELLKGRKVTCAHNIISDVANAGGVLIYDGNKLKDTHVDGNLVTGRHPGVVEEFLQVFLRQCELKQR